MAAAYAGPARRETPGRDRLLAARVLTRAGVGDVLVVAQLEEPHEPDDEAADVDHTQPDQEDPRLGAQAITVTPMVTRVESPTASGTPRNRPRHPWSVQHVFAYGSLAARPDARPARLDGFRRTWGVAMDNRIDLAGYKFYVDPATGERPAVAVAFLDLEEAPGESVAGSLVPVSADDLPGLDARERNYERHDVSNRFGDGAGRVWAYLGRPDSRARLRRALACERAVVQRAYLELCGVTEEPPCPVRDLVRVNLR